MGECDLGVLADGRDRRAQLMRCVGYEAALAVSRIFQSLQHSVHRGGEPTDLVVGLGLRYPPVQLRGRDLVHLPPDRVDGGQGATHGEPGGEPDHRHHHRHPDDQQPGEHRGGVEHVDKRSGWSERPPPRRSAPGLLLEYPSAFSQCRSVMVAQSPYD